LLVNILETIALNISGNYTLTNGDLVMMASGNALLKSTVTSKVTIIAYGKANENKVAGTFTIAIDNDKFLNDNGFWNAVKE
jgi:hypothetical protein